MARRKQTSNSIPAQPRGHEALGARLPTWEGGKLGRGDVAPLSVLIASSDRRRAERLAGMLVAHRLNVSYVRTLGEMETFLSARSWDVLIVEQELGEGDAVGALTALPTRIRPGVSVLLVTESDAECARQALRAGITDVVFAADGPRQCAERLNTALQRAHEARSRAKVDEKKNAKLKDLCRSLNQSRRALRRDVAHLSTELANFRAELDARLRQGTLASELSAILRQELDIEGLLRTVLEYILPRTGPTNAAIFLPGSSGDYSLGAYVNYDVPKETCEVLLDHLACTLAPRFEAETEIVHVSGDSLMERMGSDAEWLEDSGLVVMSCHDGEECLAVIALFRDTKAPFSPSTLATLATVRDQFAGQLSRVIRTHNRHLPKHRWGGVGDPEGGDDLDLAA